MSMHENKKSSKGKYYTQYIISWANVAADADIASSFDGPLFGSEFTEWLKFIECDEFESRNIVSMATDADNTLYTSAKHFINRFKYTVEMVSGYPIVRQYEDGDDKKSDHFVYNSRDIAISTAKEIIKKQNSF